MYEELEQQLFDYNWDDGFSFPQNLLNNDECDLALALDIFYLADGYGYIQNYPNVDYGTEDWLNFIETLMKDIIEDRYKKTDNHYEIPLTKVQKYKLNKLGVPKILISDIQKLFRYNNVCDEGKRFLFSQQKWDYMEEYLYVRQSCI